MKKILIITISLFIVTGCCAKKGCGAQPEPEPVPVDVVVEDTSAAPPVTTTTEAAEEVTGDLSKQAVEEVAAEVDENTNDSQIAIDPQTDYDFVLTDSVWVDYMIKHGDNLSLIAYNEYGNANEWRRIYSWNREKIGDNPNLIYPFHELDLKKPKGEAKQFTYEHYMHTVTSGETLWSIARKEYGDPYAWVVLFWDNEAEINRNNGELYAGMQLKVRTELWPK